MNKEKIEKFQRLQETAADFPLPCQMRENWIVIKCLKEGKDSWTVLVQENVSKITCVLKWGRNLQADLLRQECQMLQKLKNMELLKIPEGYQLFEENNGVYFLREYIEGIPLDRYVMKKGGLKEPELLETAVKICKTVEIFHRNRRIGDILKELHLTEGRNTGFGKILRALEANGSPKPEFETDEDHSYFISRLFVHEAFLKDEDSERNQKGAEKEPKRSRKGAEKRSRKKAGYIAEVGRKSRDNSG